MHFIILDTEYTWLADNPNFDKKEIIQIGALKINWCTLNVIDKFTCYVKPLLNPTIPQCEIDYTGIKQEIVDTKGVSFSEAYKKLKIFCRHDYVFTHGWRDGFQSLGDGEIIKKNIMYNKISVQEHLKYVNIAPWFKKQYENKGLMIEKQTSGQIAALLGLQDKLTFLNLGIHDALYDCYSILVGIQFFKACNLKNFAEKFISSYF